VFKFNIHDFEISKISKSWILNLNTQKAVTEAHLEKQENDVVFARERRGWHGAQLEALEHHFENFKRPTPK